MTNPKIPHTLEGVARAAPESGGDELNTPLVASLPILVRWLGRIVKWWRRMNVSKARRTSSNHSDSFRTQPGGSWPDKNVTDGPDSGQVYWQRNYGPNALRGVYDESNEAANERGEDHYHWVLGAHSSFVCSGERSEVEGEESLGTGMRRNED
jgi:hypothetical protein